MDKYSKQERRPKGSMCCNCVHALQPCAKNLDFSKYPVIGKFDGGEGVEVLMVKCLAYVPKAD